MCHCFFLLWGTGFDIESLTCVFFIGIALRLSGYPIKLFKYTIANQLINSVVFTCSR